MSLRRSSCTHRTYDRVGEEELEDLAPLCPSCHELVHAMEFAGYIQSLNPEEVADLSDDQRAEAHRHLAADQAERRRAELQATRGVDHAKRVGRSLSHRLKAALIAAAKADADTTAEVSLIEQTLVDLERKLS